MSKYKRKASPDKLSKTAREQVFLEELSNYSLEDIIDEWAGAEVGVSLAYENFILTTEEEIKYKEVRAKIKELEKLIKSLRDE